MRAGLSLLTLALCVACGGDDTDGSPDGSSRDGSSDTGTRDGESIGDGGAQTSMEVGTDGGTITSADGRLTLEIPPGALSEATTIRIQTRGPNDVAADLADLMPVYAYSLFPSGLTFSEPVRVLLTADSGDVPLEGPSNMSNVYGLVSYSSEHGREVLSIGGVDEGTDYLGILTHFSDLALVRAMRTSFILDCESDCLVGRDFSGTFAMTEPFGDDGRLAQRSGSRGMTFSGAVEVVGTPSVFTQIYNNVPVHFMYRCTEAGSGQIEGHYLVTSTEQLVVPLLGYVNETERELSALGRASVNCIDAPMADFAVVSVTPPLACTNTEVDVLVRGFNTPEDIETAGVLFVREETGSEHAAHIVSATELNPGMGEIEARLTVRVPRPVHIGSPNEWSVIATIPEGNFRSAGQLFRAQIADCPVEGTSLVGIWNTRTDTGPADNDCTGVNAGSQYRFWADGTWTDPAIDVQDTVYHRNVHKIDGTWQGSWEGSVYTLTATGCVNDNGNTNDLTGTYNPVTNLLEISVTSSRGGRPPGTNHYCSTTNTVTVSSCHTQTCEPTREPFLRGRCIYSSLTPTCYDPGDVLCYDNDGGALPTFPPGPFCDDEACVNGERCCTTEPGTRSCRNAGDACDDAIAIEECDGPEDCDPGEACCITDNGTGVFLASCMAASTCLGDGGDLPWRACKEASDCEAGFECCEDASTSLASDICGIGC